LSSKSKQNKKKRKKKGSKKASVESREADALKDEKDFDILVRNCNLSWQHNSNTIITCCLDWRSQL